MTAAVSSANSFFTLPLLAGKGWDLVALKKIVNLRALQQNPGAVTEGGFYGAFWGLSAYFAWGSVLDLGKVIQQYGAASDKLVNIGAVVKRAFLDLTSLASSSAWVIKWADGAQVITLGPILPLVMYVCYGSSFLISTVEAGADVVNILKEREEILKDVTPAGKQAHWQQLCLSIIRLVGSTCFAAWSALGIISFAGSVAVNPLLTGGLLAASIVFGVSAIFYKIYIEPPLNDVPSQKPAI